MKLLNTAFNIITLLVVVIVSLFVPVLISNLLGLDMFNAFTFINSWLKYSITILGTLLVIFYLLKKSGVIKSPVLTILSATIVTSILFSVFAWFYFPHINENGFEACKSLAFKTTLYDEDEDDNTGKTFTFVKDLKLNKGDNLGRVGTFIKENGKPSVNANTYTYISKNGQSCSLIVNESGIIQEASWVIP